MEKMKGSAASPLQHLVSTKPVAQKLKDSYQKVVRIVDDIEDDKCVDKDKVLAWYEKIFPKNKKGKC